MQSLRKTYDKRANVLYISVGEPRAAISVPLRAGIVVREDRATREFVGVTVIDADISRKADYEQVLTEFQDVPRELLPALFAQISEALSSSRGLSGR